MALTDWPQDYVLSDFNLVEKAGQIRFVQPPACLDAQKIQSHLTDMNTTILRAVDSTNTYLMNLADPLHQSLCSADIQVGGRGRRGRQWLSPFARNLAISVGFATRRELSELGGLSLVAGLALVDVLQSLGIAEAGLKWPNDVLVGGRKVCGILVELRSVNDRVEVVIGFGVNVQLHDAEIAQIDQPVTDLRRQGVKLDRTELLLLFVARLRQYVAHFDEAGFDSFVPAFDAVHVFQAQQCRLVAGDSVTLGEVLGVAPDGGLRVQTEQGEEVFHGGEVSLRRAS